MLCTQVCGRAGRGPGRGWEGVGGGGLWWRGLRGGGGRGGPHVYERGSGPGASPPPAALGSLAMVSLPVSTLPGAASLGSLSSGTGPTNTAARSPAHACRLGQRHTKWGHIPQDGLQPVSQPGCGSKPRLHSFPTYPCIKNSEWHLDQRSNKAIAAAAAADAG